MIDEQYGDEDADTMAFGQWSTLEFTGGRLERHQGGRCQGVGKGHG